MCLLDYSPCEVIALNSYQIHQTFHQFIINLPSSETKIFGSVCNIRLIKRGAVLWRRNFFSCWLRVTMTRNSDIVPFRHDVWAYHVTCDRNFLWCIACLRCPDSKTLGRPCLVHGRLDSGNCHLYYRYPSTPTRDLYPEMFLSSNQFLGPCFPIALHQCKRE